MCVLAFSSPPSRSSHCIASSQLLQLHPHETPQQEPLQLQELQPSQLQQQQHSLPLAPQEHPHAGQTLELPPPSHQQLPLGDSPKRNEAVMTSQAASEKSRRLPKGYVYEPVLPRVADPETLPAKRARKKRIADEISGGDASASSPSGVRTERAHAFCLLLFCWLQVADRHITSSRVTTPTRRSARSWQPRRRRPISPPRPPHK